MREMLGPECSGVAPLGRLHDLCLGISATSSRGMPVGLLHVDRTLCSRDLICGARLDLPELVGGSQSVRNRDEVAVSRWVKAFIQHTFHCPLLEHPDPKSFGKAAALMMSDGAHIQLSRHIGRQCAPETNPVILGLETAHPHIWVVGVWGVVSTEWTP